METIQFIIEFLGTFAFAISGTRLAASKQFDWFGGYVVGLATAIGGGTLRDVMLGLTPFWMTNSIYLICTAFALIVTIIFRKRLVYFRPRPVHHSRHTEVALRGPAFLGGNRDGLHNGCCRRCDA